MIDILLSTYNGEKFLEAQLDSILKQSYQDYNILIRDDGSSDNTISILNSYKENYPQKIFLIDNENKNLGSTGSFLTLLNHSRADLIFFCDQDDVWHSKKISLMLNFYNLNISDKEKPILIHSAAEVVDEKLSYMKNETEMFNKNKCGMEKTLCWQIFQNDVTGCTSMINASMRRKILNIELDFANIIQHDWFFANIAYLYESKFYFPEKLIKYRQHSNNVISARRISILKRIVLKLKHGISYPYYQQISEILKCLNDKSDIKGINILKDFSNLKTKTKIYRIWWHFSNKFLREGNLIIKLYQLLVC